jgi:hypothetical protein
VEWASLQRLLQRLADTENDEMSCTDCFDLVSWYVELEVAGTPGGPAMTRLQQHFRQCGVCREEYEILRDLTRSEAEGRAPSVDDLRNSL